MSETSCPHCGEPLRPIPIAWGYPTPEEFEQAERGEVVLAGCMVSDDDPPFACAACHEPLPPSALMADKPRFRAVRP